MEKNITEVDRLKDIYCQIRAQSGCGRKEALEVMGDIAKVSGNTIAKFMSGKKHCPPACMELIQQEWGIE